MTSRRGGPRPPRRAPGMMGLLSAAGSAELGREAAEADVTPATVEQRRERVRQFLLKRLAGGVGRPASGWLGLLSKQFFASAEAAYAFEYDGCDAERENCTGEVCGAWLVDADGVREVDASPASVPGERRGMWFRFSRVHFYIAPAGDWVIMASLAGPRAGCGGRYRVVPRGDGFVLAAEGKHWRA